MTFPAQTFTTGQVLTAAQMNEISTEINDLWRYTYRAVTSTSDTLVLADSYNKAINYSNTGTTTITIPNSSSVAFTTGAIINILKTGATGTLSIVQGSGVTIQSAATTSTNPTITSIGGFARIIKTGGDSFVVEGDITAAAAAPASGSWTLISTQTPSASSGFSFSSIASSYKHLLITWTGIDHSATGSSFDIRLNNSSSGIYDAMTYYGSNTTLTQYNGGGATSMGGQTIPLLGKNVANAGINNNSNGWLIIWDYTNASTTKLCSSAFRFYDSTAAAHIQVWQHNAVFSSNSAISSVDIVRLTGTATITSSANNSVKLWGSN